jgi:hypothetical protein
MPDFSQLESGEDVKDDHQIREENRPSIDG